VPGQAWHVRVLVSAAHATAGRTTRCATKLRACGSVVAPHRSHSRRPRRDVERNREECLHSWSAKQRASQAPRRCLSAHETVHALPSFPAARAIRTNGAQNERFGWAPPSRLKDGEQSGAYDNFSEDHVAQEWRECVAECYMCRGSMDRGCRLGWCPDAGRDESGCVDDVGARVCAWKHYCPNRRMGLPDDGRHRDWCDNC
jgi:hypothetical protein